MCHNGAFAVWFLHSKKGGKIQTGLNCEVDSLSKACLWLAYSSEKLIKNSKCPGIRYICFLMYKNYSYFLVYHSDYTCFYSIYRNARCHQVVPGDSSQCILPSCAPLCDEDCVFLDCHDGHCQWNDIPCTDTDHGSQTLRPLCKQEQTVSTYIP